MASVPTKKCTTCDQTITTPACPGCLAEIPATCVPITNCAGTESTLQEYITAECAAKGSYTVSAVCKNGSSVVWWKITLSASFSYSPANYFTLFFKQTIGGVEGYFPLAGGDETGISQLYTGTIKGSSFSVHVPMPTEVPLSSDDEIDFILVDNLGNISTAFKIDSDDYTLSNGNGVIDTVCS